MWALVFHHHNLVVFIVGHYVETLALFPTLTLLGLLAVGVTIDTYIRPDLKQTVQIIIAVVIGCVINYIWLQIQLVCPATGEAQRQDMQQPYLNIEENAALRMRVQLTIRLDDEFHALAPAGCHLVYLE